MRITASVHLTPSMCADTQQVLQPLWSQQQLWPLQQILTCKAMREPSSRTITRMLKPSHTDALDASTQSPLTACKRPIMRMRNSNKLRLDMLPEQTLLNANAMVEIRCATITTSVRTPAFKTSLKRTLKKMLMIESTRKSGRQSVMSLAQSLSQLSVEVLRTLLISMVPISEKRRLSNDWSGSSENIIITWLSYWGEERQYQRKYNMKLYHRFKNNNSQHTN